MTESSPDEPSSNRKDFICGVVEGFYGRPWTTEQRKDLFQKLKKWGMDMYVYAPKDDYKHRAYWRELYTVEEAEHLTSLITAAKDQGIIFCYALSPGLDITYSSQKEITTLKRKLEQVSQFGCTCFALLFDDIEPEMSEADKQIFQSFAHAQVSVTNEIHQHLGCPRFLLCPTQYCSTRAVPSVSSSEYLNTLGSKLSQQIDIMWTGPKVISKVLTTEAIEEITQVLRRPPVIWDNLHANDYDQKRIFLGPYCGRSPELIPLLRGVLTNPNCEYNANMIPIRTLAHWASCSLDAPAHMEAVSWDIKLERESEQGVCEDEAPLTLGKHVYHHRQALRQAINEWLPEFSIPKNAQGPVIKPQTTITVPPVPIIPILPSVNTCMSLMTATSNTSTTSTADMAPAIPTVNTSQLQALADGCSASNDRPILSTRVSPIETFNPVPNPVMNSLVSPTKVILNESIPNPIIPIASSNISLPSEIPVSTLPVPILGLKALEETANKDSMDKSDNGNDTLLTDSILEGSFDMKKDKDGDEDQIIVDDVETPVEEQQRNGDMSVGGYVFCCPDTPQTLSPSRPSIPEVGVEPLDVDPPSTAATDPDIVMNDGMSENGSMQVEPSHSPLSTDMMVEPTEPSDAVDEPVDNEDPSIDSNALVADDLLLLCDLFYLPFEHGSRGLRLLHDFNWLTTHAASLLPRGNKPETSEWRRRRSRFAWWMSRTRRVARRLAAAANRELRAELQPYLWELCAVLALLDAFLRWLELGKYPQNIAANTQGSYTWFSKGWREAFESGCQEPWVFRGGLTADLRRLLPVECTSDALRTLPPPTILPLTIRPYTPSDEEAVCAICHKTCRDGSDCSDLFPSDLQTLPADRLVAPFLTLVPELCMVIEDDEECVPQDVVSGDDDDKRTEPRVNGMKPEIVGYACAVLNSKEFYKRQEIAWIPEMCTKYPEQLTERQDLSQAAKECVRHFHQFVVSERAPESVTRAHPALLTCCVLPACRDPLAPPRLLTCLLAALRAHGASGVHACINATDHYLHQFYSKLGFTEVTRGSCGRVYLARSF
ncbi:protein O-GlcNAcase-like isoform X1 [Helicoverpa armigera]|uniref:protein O-GlcNAcase-like isoform X1 n=1 Tax=Helicoverpa armigera TaxID=29058 RepID=UPI0030834278